MELFSNSPNLEVGIDEVGRGSLLGRLYVGAVIFPKDIELDPKIIKDSKKFSSRKKRSEARDYVLDNCLSYGVGYCESYEIDRDGLTKCLSKAAHQAIDQLGVTPSFITVDGRGFEPYKNIPHICIDKADGKYFNVAAASIIAKVTHDEHIIDLTNKYPHLKIYDIHNNMGYGSSNHLDAIKNNGITEFHRASFGICKTKAQCLI